MPEHAPPERYEECAQALDGLPGVVATDLLETDIRTGTPSLEVVVDAERIPPSLCRVVGEHDLGIRDASQRGEPVHTVALVV